MDMACSDFIVNVFLVAKFEITFLLFFHDLSELIELLGLIILLIMRLAHILYTLEFVCVHA